MDELRMYLLVRKDLGDVPVGKMMGQAGHAFAHALHATPSVIAHAYNIDPKHAKIVLGVDDLKHLGHFMNMLLMNNIVYHMQIDAGVTVFDEATITCLATEPITKQKAVELGFSELKLF